MIDAYVAPMTVEVELAAGVERAETEIVTDRPKVAAAARRNPPLLFRRGSIYRRPAAANLDPIDRAHIVDDIRKHFTLNIEVRAAQALIQPAFDTHSQDAAGKGELEQRPPPENVNTAIAVVAVTVDDTHEARLDVMPGQQGSQVLCRLLRVLRQARFCEIELVGSVDEFDCPVEMRRDVVFDFDDDVAATQESRGIPVRGLFVSLEIGRAHV